MEKIYFTTYKNKKILIEDFSNMKFGPDFFAQLKQAQGIIASQPQNSVLACFDTTGVLFNSDVLKAMKDFTRANTSYIKAAAVVGVAGLLKLAMATLSKFAGRDFYAFNTREEAMEWLIKQ